MTDPTNSSDQINQPVPNEPISNDTNARPSQDAPLNIPKNGRIHPSMMPLERTINILIVDGGIQRR
jgi:hypothetical protein